MKGPNTHRFLEFRPVDVSREGGWSLRETSMGRFWLQNRFVSLPLGLNSVIPLQRLPRTTLFELICRVYSVNRFSKHRRGTTRACIEFSRAVWGFTDWL